MAIKPIDADSTVEAVWVLDGAFDRDAMINLEEHEMGGRLKKALEVYGDEFVEGIVTDGQLKAADAYQIMSLSGEPGCWHNLLETLPGERPTVFVLGVIPPSDFARVQSSGQSADEKKLAMFKLSLRDMREGPTKDGKVPKTTRGNWPCVDPFWLDRTFAGPLLACAVDIGLLAIRWNQTTGEDVKN